MVARVLGLSDPPRPADAADALALAICHAWRGAATDRLAQAAAAARPRRHSPSGPPGSGGAAVIASVHGRVAELLPDSAVVEVGGLGLAVMCTPATLAALRVGEPARLATALVVREDSLTLYGFADDDERAVFELLQTATGVGPRLAQAMLAVHRPDELRRAVAHDDLAALVKVPGIGRKVRPATGARAEGPARPGPRPRRGSGRRHDRRVAGAGARGAASRWAGPPGRPRRPSPPSLRTPRRWLPPVTRRRSARCCAPRCAPWTARDRPRGRRRARTAGPGQGHRRGRGRRRRAGRRGGPAPAHAGRVHRPGAGPRAARPGAGGGPAARSARRTTCCSPARPASARPPWP